MTRHRMLLLLFTIWNLLIFGVWLILPFIMAGIGQWYSGWSHLGLLAIGLLAHQLYVHQRNRELSCARRQIGVGTRPWDIVWNVLNWPLMASITITAGTEFRLHGYTLPIFTWPVGALIIAAGLALSAWAMGSNPHFEGTVRIQTERDHRVIEVGPYQIIRHPGYVGLALWSCGTPLVLLSWRAAIPAVLYLGWIALRTKLEDAFLCTNLQGYAVYATRVRYRWIPGLW